MSLPSDNRSPKKNKVDLQAESDRLLALQLSLSEKTKRADGLLLALFLGFLFTFGLLFFLLPDSTVSEEENRTLQTLPRIQSAFDGSLSERIRAGKFLDRYFSGDFAEDVSDYYADQFPARNFFVGLKGVTEIALLKGENNGILLGRDGYLFAEPSADTNTTLAALEKNLSFIEDFRTAMGDTPVTFAVAGRTIDVMQNKLPALYDTDIAEAPFTLLQNSGVDYVDLMTPLRAYAEAGEDVMYRTDHHWTTHGAYLAYTELMQAWGIEEDLLPLSEIETEQAADAFYGTSWRTGGMKWVQPDQIVFYRYAGDEDYTLEIHDDGTVMDGFYDRSYLEATDKYSAFLSGNHAYVTIEKKGDEDRPRLLLIKDSFAHAMAPLLARHFDLEIVDLRYYKGSARQLVESTGCDRILILYNMDNLTTSASLSLLAMP